MYSEYLWEKVWYGQWVWSVNCVYKLPYLPYAEVRSAHEQNVKLKCTLVLYKKNSLSYCLCIGDHSKFFDSHTKCFNYYALLAEVPIKPELRDILKELYSTKAADKWEDIGIMLMIKSSKLDTIKSAANQTTQSCLREMLKLYLQDSPSPSWAAIVEALESVGEKELATQLKSRYGSQSE